LGVGGSSTRKYKKDCLFCSYSANNPRFLISKNQHAFSIVYGMQEKGLCLSKAQILVISENHRENFSELTKEEWKGHLPLIKDAIRKISTVYKPIGFDVFSSLNKEGGQSHFHSHIHIIPKYKKNYGYCRRRWDLSLTLCDHQEIEKKLQTKQGGIIKENDKAVAELAPFGKQAGKSHIIIRPKKSISNNIEELDEETWTEMWELMKESVKRCKENLGARGFWWHTPLGQMTDVDQTSRSEFQIDIMPRWNVPTMEERHGGKTRSIPENERIAEKLRGESNLVDSVSFYELIKQKSREKARPLKIVADWDECLFAFRPFAIFEIGKISRSFKEFFKEFWENTKIISGAGSSQDKVLGYIPSGKEEELAWKKWNEVNEERKSVPDKNAPKYSRWVTELHDPFLSPAEDLLKCLKEGLIDKLLIISATKSNPSLSAKRKEERFNRTFGKFPQCSLEVPYVVRVDGKNRPHRWETIQDNCPDFDIFIDDDDVWIKSVRKHFPDRTYVLLDYKFNRRTTGNNIYHVKTTVSDLKDEDFVKVAEEYKAEKKAQRVQQNSSETQPVEPKNYLPWIMIGLIVTGLIGIITYFFLKEKK
jgi:histidine triad (HIT) family protein